MTQLPLEVYRIDMKYIRNLHKGESFAARNQCLDFERMELECEKYNSKIKKGK